MYGLRLEKSPHASQYRQLYEQLRDRIVSGSIPPSTRLCSTRQLSTDLKVSRAIVLDVVEQLSIEGYLETRHGSGTFVSPDVALRINSKPRTRVQLEKIGEPADKANVLSLMAGQPDVSLFPRRAWSRCMRGAIEYADESDLCYGDPSGYPPLRKALTEYLYRTKGIRTSPDLILITSGAAHAIDLLAKYKLGGRVVLEDPLVPFIHEVYRLHGFDTVFAKVDAEGIDPESFSWQGVDFAVVSPSHQFPLGGTLPAHRRVKLLRGAARSNALLVEDDYDGEFRFECRPIAPLQTLAPERVVYVGSFSKILSPALRLGFMVLPPDLVKPMRELKVRYSTHVETFNQMALARFIDEGSLDRHIRRMRRIYNARNQTIQDLVPEIFGSEAELSGHCTSMHLLMRLPGHRFAPSFASRAEEFGLRVEPVSFYCMNSRQHRDKLILGYGQIDRSRLKEALLALRNATKVGS